MRLWLLSGGFSLLCHAPFFIFWSFVICLIFHVSFLLTCLSRASCKSNLVSYPLFPVFPPPFVKRIYYLFFYVSLFASCQLNPVSNLSRLLSSLARVKRFICFISSDSGALCLLQPRVKRFVL